MLDRALLRRLCEVLVGLCPKEDDARMYTTFAELDLSLIDFGGNAKNRWFSIFQVADNTGKLDSILAVIQKDFGKNALFQNVYQDYLLAANHPNTISSIDQNYLAKPSGRSAVKLVLDRNPSEFTCEQQEELLEALSRLLSIGRVELDVIAIEPGSIVVTLELPTKKIFELLSMVRDGKLEQYGVYEVRDISIYPSSDLPEFIRYVLAGDYKVGDKLPPLTEISAATGMSVGKLREQLELALTMGLVEASSHHNITRADYSFLPIVRLSLLMAMTMDRNFAVGSASFWAMVRPGAGDPMQLRNPNKDLSFFEAFLSLRIHLEFIYWEEAVALLVDEDFAMLRAIVASAWQKLRERPRFQIPYPEHRELHLAIYRRLNNPFVADLLEAYWDAYEAIELNTYADYAYLQEVWHYHERIVEAICNGEFKEGKRLLLEHMQLLSTRGISFEIHVEELLEKQVPEDDRAESEKQRSRER